MTLELTTEDIRDLSGMIQSRALSPVELVQATLDRIAAVDGAIHSYIAHDGARALALARKAEAEIASGEWRGPLHGIPMAVKDNFYTRDFPTTGGSRLMQGFRTEYSATSVARLEAAGAILIGKLNTWEYGTGTGIEHFDQPQPPARNPWNPAHFTGGSSTGSGAAVAAGTAVATLGTDTGGSVRLPAAGCGVQGLKPTFGRISRHGMLPNCWSFDTPGPLGWTVEDCAILLEAIAGHDPADPVSLEAPAPAVTAGLRDGVRGLRIGIVQLADADALDPDIALALAEAARFFAEAGAECRPMPMPIPPSAYRSVAAPINWAECFSIHEQDYLERRHLMGRSLRDKLTTGFFQRSADYLAAQRERRRLTAETDALFAEVDLLLLPIIYRPAPPIEDRAAVQAYTTGSAGSVFSLTGHPAMAVRAGFARGGMPISIQLAGRYCDEATVLRAAHAYETGVQGRIARPRLDPAAAGGTAPAAA